MVVGAMAEPPVMLNSPEHFGPRHLLAQSIGAHSSDEGGRGAVSPLLSGISGSRGCPGYQAVAC